MNAKSWRQLEKLAARCSDALRDRSQQSLHVWRGDMWAIVGAHHDIRKAREKTRTAAAKQGWREDAVPAQERLRKL